MAKQKFHARAKHRRSFNMRRWIQAHQKSVFVSLTVICMGAFVVGPTLQTFMDQPGLSGGTRIVVWKGGDCMNADTVVLLVLGVASFVVALIGLTIKLIELGRR